MKNKIPPPIVTLFFGLCIYFSQEYFPKSNLEFMTILSYILYFSGFFILVLAVSLFKKQNTTVNPIKIENASSLVTSGVFEYSRNPMYLGMVLILLGLTFMFNLIGGIMFTLLFAMYITKFQIGQKKKLWKDFLEQIF